MSQDRIEFLKSVRAMIADDPSLAEDALVAVQEGLFGWRVKVEKSIAHHADFGMMAALSLPKFKTGGWLNVNNRRHRSLGRLVAVGWNLNHRKPSCLMEQELVSFVREADAHDPASAAGHYETLRARPVPQTDEGYS